MVLRGVSPKRVWREFSTLSGDVVEEWWKNFTSVDSRNRPPKQGARERDAVVVFLQLTGLVICHDKDVAWFKTHFLEGETNMKTFAIAAFVASGLCGITCGSAMAADDIVAVSWSGDVHTIDSSTGVGNLLNGSRLYPSLNASAKDSAGVIYSASGATLVTVDPATGVVTAGPTMGINGIRGMAFGPGNVLYAYNDEGFGTPDVLYTIDTTSGATTRIGLASDTGIQGMAINSQGRAYVWDIANGLATADLATGATSDVSGLPGSGDIQCLAFDANDNLWGARAALFQISTIDGSISLVGSGGYSDVRGMEFIGGSGGYTLRIGGQCPGRIVIFWDGADPGRQQGVVFASSQGNFRIPNGPCQGTVLGLGSQGIRLVRTIGTGSGSGSVSSDVGTGACGGYLQFIQLPTCATTNVARIPN